MTASRLVRAIAIVIAIAAPHLAGLLPVARVLGEQDDALLLALYFAIVLTGFGIGFAAVLTLPVKRRETSATLLSVGCIGGAVFLMFSAMFGTFLDSLQSEFGIFSEVNRNLATVFTMVLLIIAAGASRLMAEQDFDPVLTYELAPAWVKFGILVLIAPLGAAAYALAGFVESETLRSQAHRASQAELADLPAVLEEKTNWCSIGEPPPPTGFPGAVFVPYLEDLGKARHPEDAVFSRSPDRVKSLALVRVVYTKVGFYTDGADAMRADLDICLVSRDGAYVEHITDEVEPHEVVRVYGESLGRTHSRSADTVPIVVRILIAGRMQEAAPDKVD